MGAENMQVQDSGDEIFEEDDEIESEEIEPRIPPRDEDEDEDVDQEEETEAEDDEEDDEEEGEEARAASDDIEVNGKTYTVEQVEQALASAEIATENQTAFETERTQLDSERAQLGQVQQFVQGGYAALQQAVQALIPDEPALSLLQTDPAAYALQKEQRQLVMEHMSRAMDGAQQFGQGVQTVNQHDVARGRQREEQSLITKRPDLRDAGKRAVFNQQILESAMQLGFTKEDVESTTDHRILLALGHVHADLQAKKNRKQAGKRATRKPTKAGAKTSAKSANNASRRKAMNRVRSTGDIEDAIRAIT